MSAPSTSSSSTTTASSVRPVAMPARSGKRINKGMLLIICGVVTAVLTLCLVQSMVGSKTTGKAKTVVAQTKPLVVAAQPILAGEAISPASLKVVEWPADHYPGNDIKVFESPNSLLGRVVKKDIYPGEPVVAASLDEASSSGGLPVVIPNGYRAMTILVTENKGVGGFIKPGNRVDVIGSFEYRIPESSQKKMADTTGYVTQDTLQMTQTVLQDVSVLAIAQDMIEKPADNSAKGDTKPALPTVGAPGQDPTKGKVVSSVTLAVTPEQAEKLAFADARGDLRLILRPESDHTEVPLLGAVTEDVVPLKKLYEKALQVESDAGSLASMPASYGAPAKHTHHAARKPAPVTYNNFPTSYSEPSQVEVIEGNTKSVVSF